MRKKLAKILYNEFNASIGELFQFFYFNKLEIVEDNFNKLKDNFLEFRKDNQQILEEARQYYENSMKLLSKQLTPSKPLPKKVIKALEEQQKELDKLFKEEL